MCVDMHACERSMHVYLYGRFVGFFFGHAHKLAFLLTLGSS